MLWLPCSQQLHAMQVAHLRRCTIQQHISTAETAPTDKLLLLLVCMVVAMGMVSMVVVCVPAVLCQQGDTAMQRIDSSKQLHSSMGWPRLQLYLLH
jgi:hypothetical protein